MRPCYFVNQGPANMRPSKLLVQKLEEEREMGQKRMPKEKKIPQSIIQYKKNNVSMLLHIV